MRIIIKSKKDKRKIGTLKSTQNVWYTLEFRTDTKEERLFFKKLQEFIAGNYKLNVFSNHRLSSKIIIGKIKNISNKKSSE